MRLGTFRYARSFMTVRSIRDRRWLRASTVALQCLLACLPLALMPAAAVLVQSGEGVPEPAEGIGATGTVMVSGVVAQGNIVRRGPALVPSVRILSAASEAIAAVGDEGLRRLGGADARYFCHGQAFPLRC